MDIDAYVIEHEPAWQRLSDACAHGPRGLARLNGSEIDEILRLYLRVSGHLAEVQTRYRDDSLEAYLTQIVSRAHAAIYGAEPQSVRTWLGLFGARYRDAVRRTMPYIIIVAVFLVLVTVGTAIWVGTSRGARAGLVPGFIRGFVRNSGGRAALRAPAATLSTVILFNNVRVALIAFATGVAFGIPTMFMVAQNAILLGALAGATTAMGSAGRFWSLILPHGILELTAICIAAGAGVRVGWSIIDPGDRPRATALFEEARDALVVAIGVIPAFVIAALIEGFLTPTSVAGGLKIAIGVVAELAYLAVVIAPAYRRPEAFARR